MTFLGTFSLSSETSRRKINQKTSESNRFLKVTETFFFGNLRSEKKTFHFRIFFINGNIVFWSIWFAFLKMISEGNGNAPWISANVSVVLEQFLELLFFTMWFFHQHNITIELNKNENYIKLKILSNVNDIRISVSML